MQEHSFDFLSVQLKVLYLSYFLSTTFQVTVLYAQECLKITPFNFTCATVDSKNSHIFTQSDKEQVPLLPNSA